jgi:hypothetical protein
MYKKTKIAAKKHRKKLNRKKAKIKEQLAKKGRAATTS